MAESNEVIVRLGNLTASCFVIMPFSPVYQTLYERVIRPAIEEAGLPCVRADEVYTKSQVTHDVWKQIRACRLVVAELTGKNPNVLYELGLAHAIGKPSIIITRDEADVPFDLRALRFLYYNTDEPFWGENLRQQLTDMCKSVLTHNDYGSILEDIVFSGQREHTKVSRQRKQKITYRDVFGAWRSVYKIEGSAEHVWNVQLYQNEEVLSGTLIVSYVINNVLTVVHQTLTGDVKGAEVSFHGITYSYLQQGNSHYYNLDSFIGTLSSDGLTIDGKIIDEDEGTGMHRSAKVTLERVSVSEDAH